MSASVESFFELYTQRYSEGDLQGVVGMCLTPFFAVRKGEVIVLPDRSALMTHFTGVIDAYRRVSGARTWSPRAMNTVQLGEYGVFATVNWNALDEDGAVVRDTWTSYQLLTTSDGWRFLSYTNHS